MISLKHLGLVTLLLGTNGCPQGTGTSTAPQSASGVTQVSAAVPVQADGLTVEQENVRSRLIEDNKPGSIKHLYVISAMSGDVIMYSTVRGKVTSSGKRLTPTIVSAVAGQYNSQGDFIPVRVGQWSLRTPEVLQDDGTYGSSVEYIYWWDTKGIYHQLYITGGEIVQVSSQPLRVGRVIINLSPAGN